MIKLYKIFVERDMKITVIIPSAGSGTRMKANKNKLFLPLSDEKSILSHTIEKFLTHSAIDEIIIPCKDCDRENIQEILSEFSTNKNVLLVKGGETRTDSVQNALNITQSDIVLIHDGARPFVTHEVIDRVIDGVKLHGAVIPVIPPQDTVKESENGYITKTLSRESLALVQTPQGFVTEKLKYAYSIISPNEIYTDDSSVYEKIGKVFVVRGDKNNIKLTTPEDKPKEIHAGVGFDAHRFEEGRQLILGGVTVPHDKGLLGHSDADVVLHALMDALLSAVHLRDIGFHFPCTPEFKDISSVELLKRVLKMLEEKQAEIINASIVIVAEKPKLSSFIDQISKNIACLLGIPENNVSLTATTTEKLGFTGREEGIATEAIVSVKV